MNTETIDRLFDTTMYYQAGFAKYLINNTYIREISGFLNMQISNYKKNWKCIVCKQKLNTVKQIQTSEYRYPVYHIQCYMQLHDLVMQKLLQHKSIVETGYNEWNVD